VPLLARVYPNGPADVNHFNAAGGLGFMIDQLLSAGLLHEDVRTVWGKGLSAYAVEARLGENGAVMREPIAKVSGDPKVVTTADKPFQPNGGLKMLTGNLGKGVIKISAVKPERYVVEAPARVFHTQEGLQDAFKAGELTGDFVAVVRFQGPKANGMPELHKLTPPLGVLQDRGSGRGAGDRRAHVRRLGQGARSHSRDAGGQGWRADRQDPGWRHDPSRRSDRIAGGSGAGRGICRAGTGGRRPQPQRMGPGPGAVCPPAGKRRHRR
jgi:hypothetical protein